MEKLEPKFEQGIWLGVCPRTDEAIIGASTGIVRAGTVKRQAIEDAWSSTSLLSVSTTAWTVGKLSKRHEFTVEGIEEDKVIKVDESELPGYPRRFRMSKDDIERIGYSDGCVGCNAMHQGKPTQRHSEYWRLRVPEDPKGSENGRQRLEKAEERFTEALVRAGERSENLGPRAMMSSDENRGASTSAQVGESEVPRAPSASGMSAYSPSRLQIPPGIQHCMNPLRDRHPALVMAGGQAMENQMKTPRRQAWPAETQMSMAGNASRFDRQQMRGPAHPRGHKPRRRWRESGSQTEMTKTAVTTSEMWMSQRRQTGGRSQPSVEISGMKTQGP